MNNQEPQSQASPLPDPAFNPLALSGRAAIVAVTEFYETTAADANNVRYQWERRGKTAEATAAHYREMLQQVANVVRPKETETFADAVSNAIAAAGAEAEAIRATYVKLCKAHNIKEPCGKFTTVEGQTDANCVTCGHPEEVHA